MESLTVPDEETRQRRELFMEKYDEVAGKYLEVKESIRKKSRHQMKAYPNLVSKSERLRRQREKRDRKKS